MALKREVGPRDHWGLSSQSCRGLSSGDHSQNKLHLKTFLLSETH